MVLGRGCFTKEEEDWEEEEAIFSRSLYICLNSSVTYRLSLNRWRTLRSATTSHRERRFLLSCGLCW